MHVLPSGEAFAVARNGEGLATLNERLSGLSATIVAVEASSRRWWRVRWPAQRCVS